MTCINVTDEIRLEIISPFYAEMVYAVIDKNRAYLRKFLGWVDSTKSPEDSYAYIRGALKLYAEKKEITYFIFYKNELVGTTSIWIKHEDTAVCELGYWLCENVSRHGVATKCARELMKVGFEFLKAEKIEISCSTVNVGSNRIAEKLGMKLEGTLRRAENVNGIVYDHNVYGILREEISLTYPEGNNS